MRWYRWSCDNGHGEVVHSLTPDDMNGTIENVCGTCAEEGLGDKVSVTVSVHDAPHYNDVGQPGHADWVDLDLVRQREERVDD